MSPELLELRRLIADDGWAMTFQTFGQYRTALLKAIDKIAADAVAPLPHEAPPLRQVVSPERQPKG